MKRWWCSPRSTSRRWWLRFRRRAAAVHAGVVDPSVDNMLKDYQRTARKAGTGSAADESPCYPDDPDSKLNACVRKCAADLAGRQADKADPAGVLRPQHTERTMEPSMSMRMSAPKLIADGVPAEESRLYP